MFPLKVTQGKTWENWGTYGKVFESFGSLSDLCII